jgi:branched-chain amino acid transport system permease protein
MRYGPWVFVMLAAVVPLLVASGYHLFQLTLVVIYALAILGFNLVTGYNGQISIGHGAFYAVGAYVTAVLMDQFGMPYWATLPFSAVISAIIGFLIGFPALRLAGVYLALTTFALAVATPQLLKYKAFESWTGGVQGIVLDKPTAPFGLPLDDDQWVYLFTYAVGVVMFVLAANLVSGRIGRAMTAIRDHALAAETMGIDIAMLKTRTFAVGAMFTGVAGSLGAIAVQFVSPDSYSVVLSIVLFVGLIVGGVSTIIGPIFGAAFIVFVPNIAEQVSKAAPSAVYGIILIAFMFVMPRGIWGWVRHRWLNRLAGRAAAEDAPSIRMERKILAGHGPAGADLPNAKVPAGRED